MRKVLFFLLLLLLPALAAPVDVKTELDKSKVEVGQPVRLTVDLLVSPGAELDATPADSFKFAPFEVRDAARTILPNEGDRKKVRYTFKLAPFEEGKLQVPPATFSYKRGDQSAKVSSAAQSVEVTRVTGTKEDKEGEIRDLKAGVASPVPTALYVAGAILLVVVLLALRALYKAATARRKVKVLEPALPPFEHALRELERLRAEHLPEQGRHEEYYDRLTGTLRTYLSWRYGVPMLERTSSEILGDLRRQETLPAEPFAQLKRVLEEGDLVKFARFGPEATHCDERLSNARDILEYSRPVVERPLAGSGGPR